LSGKRWLLPTDEGVYRLNLKTIAKQAGVSTATVSNVINGNHHKVSRTTIEKVQRIIQELGYEPNATARSLASKRSRIIGVVVANIDQQDHFFSNPHYAHLLALLEKHIRAQGYYMMLRCVTASQDSLQLLRSWNVDGVIYFGTFPEDIPVIQEQVSIPVVFIDAYAKERRYVNVGVDDYKGGYLSGKYLLEMGHRDIALVGIGFQYYGVNGQRGKGFRQACSEHGIAVGEDRIFECITSYQSGIELGRQIARSEIPFTAVAAMADILAFGIMEGLRQEGKRVPEDISVIGFDNLQECLYTHPKLTTISQNIEEKAERVAKKLMEMMNGNTEVESERNDVILVERESVRAIRDNRR